MKTKELLLSLIALFLLLSGLLVTIENEIIDGENLLHSQDQHNETATYKLKLATR